MTDSDTSMYSEIEYDYRQPTTPHWHNNHCTWRAKGGVVLYPEEMSVEYREHCIQYVARTAYEGNRERALEQVPILRKFQRLNSEEVYANLASMDEAEGYNERTD